MSKKLLLGIVLICLLVTGISCGHQRKDAVPAQNVPVAEPQNGGTVESSENTGQPPAEPDTRDKTNKDTKTDQQIVIKTGNKGSGEEADEMLEEVDRQLDALIKTLDALDTVEIDELQDKGGAE